MILTWPFIQINNTSRTECYEKNYIKFIRIDLNINAAQEPANVNSELQRDAL